MTKVKFLKSNKKVARKLKVCGYLSENPGEDCFKIYKEFDKKLEKEFTKHVNSLADEIIEKNVEERKNFYISRDKFYTLELHKFFDMGKEESIQKIENFEHKYENKFHNLKWKCDKIELLVPQRGDTFYCRVFGSSLNPERLSLFCEERRRYFRLKGSEWKFGDKKEEIYGKFLLNDKKIKIKKGSKKEPKFKHSSYRNKYKRTKDEEIQLNVMRMAYLAPNDRKLLREIDKQSYLWDEMNEYSFNELEEFADEINEFTSNMWIKEGDNKKEKDPAWSDGLKEILSEFEDYDLEEIVDVLKEYSEKNRMFVEGDFVQDHQTLYDDFFKIDKNKEVVEKEHRNYVQNKMRFKGHVPEWIVKEQEGKTFPGLKSAIHRKNLEDQGILELIEKYYKDFIFL